MLARMRGIVKRLGAVALLAFLVRALVPEGFMLAEASAGRYLTLTLCNGHGDAEVMDLATGAILSHGHHSAAGAPKSGDKSSDKDKPACPYAASAVFDAPQLAIDRVVNSDVGDTVDVATPAVRPGQGIPAPPPPSTGPPILS